MDFVRENGVLPLRPIVQLGYSVPDVDAAMAKWVEKMGVGPFYVMRDLRVESTYRGEPSEFYSTCACAQWQDVQIELTQQLDDRPSMIRDICPPEETKLISYAWFSDDLDEEARRMEALGFPTAFTCSSPGSGHRTMFFDTSPILGVMSEVYSENEALRMVYKKIADAAVDWDGKRPVRDFEELFA